MAIGDLEEVTAKEMADLLETDFGHRFDQRALPSNLAPTASASSRSHRGSSRPRRSTPTGRRSRPLDSATSSPVSPRASSREEPITVDRPGPAVISHAVVGAVCFRTGEEGAAAFDLLTSRCARSTRSTTARRFRATNPVTLSGWIATTRLAPST